MQVVDISDFKITKLYLMLLIRLATYFDYKVEDIGQV